MKNIITKTGNVKTQDKLDYSFPFVYVMVLTVAMSFLACKESDKSISSRSTLKSPPSSKQETQKLSLFTDSSYIITLQTLGDDSTVVSLFRNNQIEKKDTLWKHVVESDYLGYDTVDYNADGTSDLLVLNTVNQSSPKYHLFLVDDKFQSLKKVKGFENISTPSFDKENNIIVGYERSGTEFNYDFYILKNSTLLNLNHSFQVDDQSEVDNAYEAAIKKLQQKQRKNSQ